VHDTAEAEGSSYFPDDAKEAALEHEAGQARGARSIVARIRRWWSPARIDPNKPHQFRSIDPASARVGTDAELGECRLSGCGRPADDPIHA
jgi:hypothetical protein